MEVLKDTRQSTLARSQNGAEDLQVRAMNTLKPRLDAPTLVTLPPSIALGKVGYYGGLGYPLSSRAHQTLAQPSGVRFGSPIIATKHGLTSSSL